MSFLGLFVLSLLERKNHLKLFTTYVYGYTKLLFMCLRDFCSLVYSFLHLLIQQIFFKVFIVSRIVEGMLSDSNVLRMKEKWKMYFAEIAKTDTHLSMHIHKHGP